MKLKTAFTRWFKVKCIASISILSINSLLQAQNSPSQSETYQDLSSSYVQRVEQASEALLQTRESILAERAPLAEAIQQLQEELIELQAETEEWKLRIKNHEQERSQLSSRIDSYKKNINYLRLLSEETHSSVESSLLPGEGQIYQQILQEVQLLRQHRDLTHTPEINQRSVSAALDRIDSALGGFTQKGQAIEDSSNRILEGTILHIGPATYFASDDYKTTGLLKNMDGSVMPHLMSLPGFSSKDARQIVEKQETWIPLDATGGRAMKMENAKGTVWDHIQKGGIVAYIILGLGAFGLLTGLLKLWDFRELSVDSPKNFYQKISNLTLQDIQTSHTDFASFRNSVKQLVEIGIRHSNRRRELIDEMLYAYVLLQRNHHEKRLPLLRVVAASAPLLGLLGTVVGMIKTFTLITVFGTGNASKLSSGISEALVTTELGLIVAIPTVIIFGYLSHQTETRLNLLEQYSTDLSNQIESLKENGE